MQRDLLVLLIGAAMVLTGPTSLIAQEQPAAPAAEDAREADLEGGAERVGTGLIALYSADTLSEDGMLLDLGGKLEPLNLEICSGAVSRVEINDGALVFGPPTEPEPPGAFSLWPATALVRAVKTAGALSVEAWLSSADTKQRGPARIVSISRDSALRNVTLAQDLSQFVLRLRTSGSNEGGNPELRTPENAVVVGALQHVVITFDGRTAVFYIDGEQVAETDHFAGTLDGWDESMHIMLGNEFDGNREWAGEIYLVAVYNVALSQDQVQTNYDAGP